MTDGRTTWRVINADVREGLAQLADESVHCVVTSPPYWGLRDYGVAGQLGLEETPQGFLDTMVGVFREVRRVLRSDGVCWVNMGDSYASTPPGCGGAPKSSGLHGVMSEAYRATLNAGAGTKRNTIAGGLKPKDLVGMPWRLALAMQADGWWLRSDCIWHKPNPMPESVTDRPTKAHEYVFLLTKAERYFYDEQAVRQPYAESTLPQSARPYGGVATKDYAQGLAQDPSETKRRVAESLERRGGANLRTVWSIPTQPYAGAHFATFPEALAERCIRAGTSERGCCAKCSAPRVRIVESEFVPQSGASPEKVVRAPGSLDQSNRWVGTPRGRTETHSVGWRPMCDCRGGGGTEGAPYASVPCTVLDPFTGSGTTGAVAVGLFRSFVGVELNPEYVKLARQRIGAVAPLIVKERK